MRRTLEYWPDEGGYVGRLREVPGVFSQGASVAELEDNIRDAYELVLADAGCRERGASGCLGEGNRGTCVLHRHGGGEVFVERHPAVVPAVDGGSGPTPTMH
jgi:predicted RNase H-like HicB family nuclease